LSLQPINFFFKRKQKGRSCFSFNNSQTLLNFGSAGLMLLNPLQLTASQIFRFKLFLKKASRKPDCTRRFVWFNAFPHIPLTRKPNGTRMGKGKGKLECWFTNVTGGSILLELRNLRRGRSAFFIKQMSNKIGTPTKSLFANNLYLNFPIKVSKKVAFATFW
jgi:large subunit ribosomal protein L16